MYAVVGHDGEIKRMFEKADSANKAARGVDHVVPVPDETTYDDLVGRYYDAETEKYRTFVYRECRSMAGRVSGVSYKVSYQLLDGRWLNGVRHTDRGDLMTDVEISSKSSV